VTSTSSSSIRASDLPGLLLVVKRGGMVVICAGTTGFNLTFDARFVWMHQKRVQGSHFANLKQAAAGQPAGDRAPHRSLHERGLPLGRHSQGPHQDVEEPAQARQHGGAGLRQAPRPAEDALDE
jgi:crotonyl-CoA carboxylase/reductase